MTLDTGECPHCGKPTTDVLCARCVNLVERRLGDIPALVDELELTVTRQARTGGAGHRKKGDDQPLPYNAAASAKRSHVNILVEWSDHVAAHTLSRPVPLTQKLGDDKRRTRAAVVILLSNLSWFRVNPEAPAAADAIWTIRDELRRVIDRTPERLFAGPCRAPLPAEVTEDDGYITVTTKPGKCQLDLYRKWGRDTIVCDGYRDPAESGGCHAVHTVNEDRRAFLMASIEDHLLPLRVVWESLYVLIPGCEVPWETTRKWPRPRRVELTDRAGRPLLDRRGRPRYRIVPARLVPRSHNDAGELFRGGDILDLARDEIPRTGRKRTRHRTDRQATA